jgi:hypothetical protein
LLPPAASGKERIVQETKMLQVYRDTGSFLTSKSTEIPGEIIWMDLLNPSKPRALPLISLDPVSG